MFAPNVVKVFFQGELIGEGQASDSHESIDVAVRLMREYCLSGRFTFETTFEDGTKSGGPLRPSRWDEGFNG